MFLNDIFISIFISKLWEFFCQIIINNKIIHNKCNQIKILHKRSWKEEGEERQNEKITIRIFCKKSDCFEFNPLLKWEIYLPFSALKKSGFFNLTDLRWPNRVPCKMTKQLKILNLLCSIQKKLRASGASKAGQVSQPMRAKRARAGVHANCTV